MSAGVIQAAEPTDRVETDGRRRRGDASRRAILAAATAVIAAEGPSALTHRAVATEAGVPPGRVAYHFPTVDELLHAAATQYLDEFDRRLRRTAERAATSRRSLIEVCTDLLWDLITDGSAAFLAMVEVRLALHRRGTAIDGERVVGVVEAFGADGEQAASVVASLFGFAVLAATEPSPPSRTQVRRHVAAVLEGQP